MTADDAVAHDMHGAPDPVPTHPEAVPGDPATVRWIVPAGLLGMVGPVGRCPAPLAALREDGDVRAIVAEPAALRLTLAPGRSWRADGARIRAALVDALGQLRDGIAALAPETVALGMPALLDPHRPGATAGLNPTDPAHAGGALSGEGERPSSGSPAAGRFPATPADSPDAVLQAAVDEALAGPAGQYLRSHGGTVRVVSAEAGTVVLDLGGTCRSCPARGFTLQMRLEAEIRRLYPDLREVRTAG